MGTRPWRGFCAIRAGARIAPETRLTPDLHRTELTVQEQADHIAEWLLLTGERESGASCPTKPGSGQESEGS